MGESLLEKKLSSVSLQTGPVVKERVQRVKRVLSYKLFKSKYKIRGASLISQMVTNLPAMQEAQV